MWQPIEGSIDPSDLSILLSEIYDSDIDVRSSALANIIALDSVETLPILLEIADNTELVSTAIWELLEHHRSGTGVIIFEEFNRGREVTTEFLETAEQSLIEAIEHNIGSLTPNMFRLSEIGSDLAISPLQKIIKSDAYSYYDEPEDAVISLSTIGTNAAKIALLQVLIDRPNLGRSVFDIFSDDGKLGLVPQLWSAHRQNYVDSALAAISQIQEKEGLYNPDFSDRSHPLFEPPRPRLRDILLGDSN